MISIGSARNASVRGALPHRAWVVFSMLLSCCGNSTSRQSDQSDLEFHTLVYSKDFGKRFKLPRQGVYPLDRGLEAMAVRVEVDPRRGPRCLLDVYLSDDIAFDYPEGTAGRLSDTRDDGPMFFIGHISEPDSRADTERWAQGEVFLLRSLDYSESEKRGAYESGSVTAYARDLLPGLNWVSVSVLCSLLFPENGPAKLWLRHIAATKKTLSIDHPEESDADGFAVPQALLLHSAEATRKAARAPVIMGPNGDPPKGKHQQYSLPPRAPN